MSRFTPARRAAISVWTGASVIWATVGLAIGLDNRQEEAPPPESEAPAVGLAATAPIPRAPASGLVVIRAQPRNQSPDEDVAVTSPTQAEPAPVEAATPPRPVSSGS